MMWRRLKFALGLVCATIVLSSCLSQSDDTDGPSEAPPSTPGSTVVAPVTLTSASSVLNNQNQITITGSCLASSLVTVAGDSNSSGGCAGNGTFSVTTTKTVDGTYHFSITQGFSSSYVSSAVVVTWTRDTVPPAAPVITSPTNPPYYSNTSSITIQGTCQTGNTVKLTGAVTTSVACAANTFSVTVSKSTDGLYSYLVSQQDLAGNTSQTSSVTWVRDTSAPAAPTITSPANPYSSADTDFALNGNCEVGALVALSGSLTDSAQCATGTFSFPIEETSDGTYNFSLKQTDRAGNPSSAQAFSWTRTSVVPNTPVIDFPAASPFYSNGSSLTITGECATGDTVNLSGSATGSMTCASSAFSFTVNESADGSYTFNVTQTLSSLTSGAASVTWLRDTAAPAAPVITSPTSNPLSSNNRTLILTGTCETGATVQMSGSATASTSCAAGTFSMTTNETVDGTYNFTLTQTDQAENTSASAAFTWNLDTAAPAAVTVTSHSTPYTSNANSVVISGACESLATVNLTGASTLTTTCASSAYSFTVNKSADGVYNFSLSESDLAGNQSATTSFSWQRDTVAPTAPTIQNPGSNPYTSATSSLTIAGACQAGATVNLSGSATNSQSCTSGTYSFSVTESVDGTYNFTLNQTDVAGNTSPNATQQWVRDSSVPAAPTITSPNPNPIHTNGSSLTIAGGCISGYTVLLSGSASGSVTCASSAFSFNATASTDGQYTYQVIQKSLANVSSAAATVTWTRDTVAPTKPTITAPATTPYYSNGNTLTLSGACESAATVSLSGSATASTSCVSSAYSFTVTKSVDGTYTLNVKQTDLAGNASTTSSVTWIRDTVAPAPVTVTSPNANPFGSGDSTIAIAGGCEANATVALSGAATGSIKCSATGAYSFNVNESVDGTYDFSLVQTDLAGNPSTASAFEWIRDTTIPSTPSIIAPSTDPYYSNQSNVTITVTCEAGLAPADAVVTLSGDVVASDVTSPAGSLTQNCTSSPVTFVVHKTIDDSYTFTLEQENPNNGTTSASSSFTWVRDTSTPPTPNITNPASTPFTSPGNLTISGGCEANATVNLAGSSTQSMLCPLSGNYTFNVVEATDATYNFSVTQTDLSGNVSGAATLAWIRNSSSLTPPTITNPAVNPLVGNDSSIAIQGGCTDGYQVVLSGNVTASDVTDPANSLTQTCAGGTYEFDVTKAADGTYTLSLNQSYSGLNSSKTSVTWTLDTIAPTPSISSTPPATNLNTAASFAFTSNESGSTFNCSLDGAAYSSCTSPVTLATLTNASHTYAIEAVDIAGNVSSPVSYTWTQAAYKTLALYHLSSSSPTTDSSLFGAAGYDNTLTATGSPSINTTGKFPTSSPSSRNFGTSTYYSATSNASLNAGVSTMTIEGFVRITSSPSTGTHYTLVSKSNASPNLGWELQLTRYSSSRYQLTFVGSQNGTTSTTVNSNAFSASTNTWYYYAVTWSKGTVHFYFGPTSASSKGTKTIGTSGSATLYATTAPLRLGADYTSSTSGSSLWLNGAMDEVRLSQVVRTITFPTGEYTGD